MLTKQPSLRIVAEPLRRPAGVMTPIAPPAATPLPAEVPGPKRTSAPV